MIFRNNIFTGGGFATGSYMQGGFLVWADESTNQGLIVSPTDLSGSECAWQNQPYQSVTTTNTYGSGQTNTTNILASTVATPAAELCDAYSNDGYSDWFLPNQTELLLVFNAYNIGAIDNANIRGFRTYPGAGTQGYWTSYSVASNTARFVDFQVPSSYAGQVGNGFRDSGPVSPGPGLWVRACRYVTFT